MSDIKGKVFRNPAGGFVSIYGWSVEGIGKVLIRKCLKDGTVKGLPRIDKVALASLGEFIPDKLSWCERKHPMRDYEHFKETVLNRRPWPDFGLEIGECPHCRNTLEFEIEEPINDARNPS